MALAASACDDITKVKAYLDGGGNPNATLVRPVAQCAGRPGPGVCAAQATTANNPKNTQAVSVRALWLTRVLYRWCVLMRLASANND